MRDFIDGTIKGWPCNIMVQHDAGGRAYGIQCAAYTNEDGESAPDDIQAIIEEIEWEGRPADLLKKAKKLGFVPDED